FVGLWARALIAILPPPSRPSMSSPSRGTSSSRSRGALGPAHACRYGGRACPEQGGRERRGGAYRGRWRASAPDGSGLRPFRRRAHRETMQWYRGSEALPLPSLVAFVAGIDQACVVHIGMLGRAFPLAGSLR